MAKNQNRLLKQIYFGKLAQRLQCSSCGLVVLRIQIDKREFPYGEIKLKNARKETKQNGSKKKYRDKVRGTIQQRPEVFSLSSQKLPRGLAWSSTVVYRYKIDTIYTWVCIYSPVAPASARSGEQSFLISRIKEPFTDAISLLNSGVSREAANVVLLHLNNILNNILKIS